MALINRIARLFTADIHAVLDQIEEPETLLRQAIREMEDDVAASAARLQQTAHTIATLGARGEELEQALRGTSEELDVCLDSGEENLARTLIKRRLQTQRLLKRVAARLSAAHTDQLNQQKSLHDHQATLESMRQKAELFAERQPRQAQHPPVNDEFTWSAQELCVSDSDVEVALLREKKRREQNLQEHGRGTVA